MFLSMRLYKQYILYIRFCLALIVFFSFTSNVEAKDFVVVIDAGHGGHDPGAIGSFSKEKNINLNVALKLGKLIKSNCPDVKVIYTRDRDIFIPLDRRADIANDAKADLFISVHTNSVAGSKTATGASTWTLGLAKSEANLAVAKRENSVILYESDYKTRYAGFNPNSSESYIIFEFMQDKYMSQSVHLGSLIQKEFRNTCKRPDRGVHQAGFLVLKASAMPSVLVELGFISTPQEEQYLNSEAGSNTLANGIFRAFLAYKREHEIRMTGSSQTKKVEELPEEKVSPVLPDIPTSDLKAAEDSTQEIESKIVQPDVEQQKERTVSPRRNRNNIVSRQTNNDETVFKIQILTSSALIPANDKRLKGLAGVEYYQENGLYKYTYGPSTNYNAVLKIKKEISSIFKDAFIIAFKNGEKVNINTAIAEFKKRKTSNKD